MVARILILQLFCICLFLSSIDGYSQENSDQVKLVVSSSVFVSGDLVDLQILPLDEKGGLIESGAFVNLYVVSSEGKTQTIERFHTKDFDHGKAFFLPSDLTTGNYKLVAHIPSSKYESEAMIHVYNPTIFSSSIAPENANPKLGLETRLSTDPLKVSLEHSGQEESKLMISDSNFSSAGVIAVKVFDPSLEAIPVTGQIKPSKIGDLNESEIKILSLTDHPTSRYSVFFLSQGVVEEYYHEDLEEMKSKLSLHLGNSPVFIYQFDQQGNRLGEVEIELPKLKDFQFEKFENEVPFDEGVRSIIDHKRTRKYLDQIYRNDLDHVTSYYDQLEKLSPDDIYETDQYEGVATLREAFAGIVGKTSAVRQQGKYVIRMSPRNAGYKYTEGPLILFNGMPMFDLDSLIETPFHELESIAVYNSIESQKRFGTLGMFGVLEIQLKSEFDNPVEKEFESFPIYHGINDLVRVQEQPSIDSPDLRPVLIWDGSSLVDLSEPIQITWENSDVKSDLMLFVDYLNSEGEIRQWIQQISPSEN